MGGVKSIIVYQPPTQIDEAGNYLVSDDGAYREHFAEVCADQGVLFVDMTDDFRALYEEKHILAHGFANSGVGAGHLNKYGHEAIAARLAAVIREDAYGD